MEITEKKRALFHIVSLEKERAGHETEISSKQTTLRMLNLDLEIAQEKYEKIERVGIKGFLLGLMGKREFNGLLFKQRHSNRFSSSIHTSFMKVPIDLIYVDCDMRISQVTTLKPWRIFIPDNDNSKYILELPENSINRKRNN